MQKPTPIACRPNLANRGGCTFIHQKEERLVRKFQEWPHTRLIVLLTAVAGVLVLAGCGSSSFVEQ